MLQTNEIKRKSAINQSYRIIHTFFLRRTLPKYPRMFLHENAVLTIGLTDQSDYSICILIGQNFHPFSTMKKLFIFRNVATRNPSIAKPFWTLVDVNLHFND